MILLKIIGWILGAVFGILVLLLFLFSIADWTLRFRLENGRFTLRAGAIPFLFTLSLTGKEDKPQKKQKKSVSNQKQAAKKVQQQAENHPEDTSGLFQTLRDLAGAFLPPAGKMLRHLRFRKIFLFITVSEPDAASTAIRYGELSAALPSSIAAAENLFDLRVSKLGIRYDFLARGTRVFLAGDIRMRGGWILLAAADTLVRFIRRSLRSTDSVKSDAKKQAPKEHDSVLSK